MSLEVRKLKNITRTLQNGQDEQMLTILATISQDQAPLVSH